MGKQLSRLTGPERALLWCRHPMGPEPEPWCRRPKVPVSSWNHLMGPVPAQAWSERAREREQRERAPVLSSLVLERA